MNPRIRECAIEAGLDSNYIEGFDSIYSKQLERFAQLIVRECARIACNTDLEDVEGGDSAVLRAAGEQIERTFRS